MSGGRVPCIGVGVDGSVGIDVVGVVGTGFVVVEIVVVVDNVVCIGVGIDGCVGSVVVGVGVVPIFCYYPLKDPPIIPAVIFPVPTSRRQN